MTTDTQLTIDGTELDEQLRIETTGRVIRPFGWMIDAVVDEYKLAVTDDGLHVRAVDAANVMYVDATLPASELESLSVEGDETAVGLNTSAFASALSDARYGESTDDPVVISAEGQTLETVVERDYHGHDATVTDRMGTIDPAGIRPQPDLLDMDWVAFDFDPDAFIDIVKSFDLTDYVALSVADGRLRFAAETDTQSRQIAVDVDTDEQVDETWFSKGYLESAAEGLKAGYADRGSLHLAPDFPMSVQATTEQGIEVAYTIAPRIQSD